MVHYFDRKTSAVVEQSVSPSVLEGKEILETVCPVNPLTGKRSSLVEALLSVTTDPKKKYLIGQILQELPTLRNNPNMDDEDRMAVLSERLSSGTPSEDEAFAERLASLSDVLFRGSPQAVKEAVKDVVKPVMDSPVVPASDAAPVSE